MAWNPLPITGSLRAWMTSQSASSSVGPFSYTPFAVQVGINYKAAAAAVQTTFGSLPLSVGTAGDVTAGFEASFELAQQWTTSNINQNTNEDKNYYLDLPDSIWLPAAKGVVKYWTGATMAPSPPPPGGGVGTTNVVVIPGTSVPLNSLIGVAFKQNNATALCGLLNTAFIAHLKTVTGIWTGLAAAGSPPPPFVFPWVTLN